MILVDANLLIYAYASSSDQHDPAREWLDQRLSGTESVGLPWPSLLAFLRIVSNPRIFPKSQPIAAAWEQVTQWLSCDAVWIPNPTERHAEILVALLASGAHGNLVSDAHLAALAIEHGLTLYSADTDFARFRGLRWINPLA